MRELIARFHSDDRGATAIEYGLIAGLMAVAVVAAFPSITTALTTTFTNIGAKLVVN